MIYPMFLLILLTFAYGGYMAYSRVHSTKKGEMNYRYFKTMSGFEVSERVQITSRHFNNLLETPPLFYIAGALIIAMGLENSFTVVVAWCYFLFRCAHTYIHNGYNNPLHRMYAYICSLACLFSLWLHLVIRL